MSPKQKYLQDVEAGVISQDAAQLEVLDELDRICRQLQERPESSGFIQRLTAKFRHPANQVQGLYVWGGVGRGKTYLMDTFFDALQTQRKLRVHFHRFMQMVHQRLRQLGQVKDPLLTVAKEFSQQFDIICFDEFFVSDIGDAMILGTLTTEMFELGMTMVATSNIEPDGLYKDGLQRTRFLPCIAQIKQHMVVKELVSDTDYRLRVLDQAKLYWTPLNQDSIQGLSQEFKLLLPPHGEVSWSSVIDVLGRDISCRAWCEGVAWFDFSALCDGPRSQNDYIELARLFHTVIIDNLYALTEQTEEQARRFINLIDEFYDRNVKVLIAAEMGIDRLYQGARVKFEFERTQSRLIEMQSHDYLSQPHCP